VTRYVVNRILWAGVLLLVTSWFTFVIFFVIPAEETQVGRFQGADYTMQGAYRLGGNPLPQEYFEFLRKTFFHGTLGYSFVSRESVLAMLARTLPVTASLIVGGLIICLLIALPVGIVSALRPRTLLDRMLMIFVLIGISAHPVWVGLVLSYAFGVKLHALPVGNYCDFFNSPTDCGGAVDWADHLVLPWITFAILFGALYTRMIRASVLESLDEDYVRTATAKGGTRWGVLRGHVLRNAMLPVVTMLGMDAALAFGGAIFIESGYGLPGMGKLTVNALARRDLPVLMGVVLVVTAAIVVFNLVVDLLYGWLDPRVRIAGEHKAEEPEGVAVQVRPRTAPGTS
jgi:peptide/nickel transport system permease protein